MPKTRVQKQDIIKDLTDKIQRSKSVVLANYQGLTMSQLSELRNTLRDQDAEFEIIKNTLLDLALKDSHLPQVPDQINQGPTAVLISYSDEVEPLKTLSKTLKTAQIGQLKAGFLDSQFLDTTAINRLSELPGKQQLRGQAVGLLASPLQGMVGVLSANLRNLVYALNQIKQQRGG